MGVEGAAAASTPVSTSTDWVHTLFCASVSVPFCFACLLLSVLFHLYYYDYSTTITCTCCIHNSSLIDRLEVFSNGMIKQKVAGLANELQGCSDVFYSNAATNIESNRRCWICTRFKLPSSDFLPLKWHRLDL